MTIMNRLFLATVFGLFAFTAGATTENNNTTGQAAANCAATRAYAKQKKTVKVGSFRNIVITGSSDVVFRQSRNGKTTVWIEGTEEDINSTSVKASHGTLTVSNSGGSRFMGFSSGNDAKIYVEAPKLDAVTVTGSGDFDAKNMVKTSSLSIVVNGSGDVELSDISCHDLSVVVRGSGDVDIDRAAVSHSADLSIAGSGDIEAKFVNSGNINCSVKGSGDIELSGEARSLDKKVSGSGDINARKLRITRR